MSIAAAEATRSAAWLEEPGFGVYVHIPFCRHRCHYCDFNTYEGQEAFHEDYVAALVRDIERSVGDFPRATSVFFGGGTPTLLPARSLARILQAVRDRIGIDHGAEVTVEANPETVDEGIFEALLEAGFGRVSIGIQSLAPGVLRALGREHSRQTALDAMKAARRAGVADVNADLIYGSPWERPEDWRSSLEGVLAELPDHISAYALTVEEGTPLATLVRTGRAPAVDPDIQADRYEAANELLAEAGYGRYEISNWARPARASRHNVLYWSAGNYLGFGAGAHGHLDGRRSWAIRLPRDFIAAVDDGRSTEDGAESLEADDRAGEALILGLRLASGVDLAGFYRRFGDLSGSRAEALEELERLGLVSRAEGWLRLSGPATLIANEVLCRLV
jgi:putative oxygen-independent coproporphyrinogen III oxidase